MNLGALIFLRLNFNRRKIDLKGERGRVEECQKGESGSVDGLQLTCHGDFQGHRP